MQPRLRASTRSLATLGIAVMTQDAIMAAAIVDLCHAFATFNAGLRRLVQCDQERNQELRPQINVVVA
jgi:hypothetical protein